MTYDAVNTALASHGLMILGGFHPTADDLAPKGTQTLLMIGPNPRFWDVFSKADEYQDGADDPMDRWSRQVIGTLACSVNAKAVFPFGGPPFQPFIAWAQRTGRAWVSPVGLLVHDTAGLFVSYRGALALKERIALPQPPDKPCDTCVQPCISACPVDALSATSYDVPSCKTYVKTSGDNCLSMGCKVRRSCPVSKAFDRDPEQSGFHMRAFVG